MAKRKESKLKARKKLWLQLIAPDVFHNKLLGETHVYSKDDALGKTLRANLMFLTNDIKKQNMTATFKVMNIVGERAKTDIIGLNISPAFIKRIVRRERKRLDESFMCTTLDERRVRIKPILVTRSATTSSVTKAMRVNAVEMILKNTKKMKYHELINEIVSHRFQHGLRDRLKKIYPLAALELKSVQLVTESRKKAEETAEEPKKEEVVEKKEEKKEITEKKEEVKPKEEPKKEAVKTEKKEEKPTEEPKETVKTEKEESK